MPHFLIIIAWIALALALFCSLWIALDILAGHHQHMWIMNLVWPITALYAGPIALWFYYRVGRKMTHRAMQQKPPDSHKPFPIVSATATTHCGAGCTLGDIVGESFVAAVPIVLFGHKLFGAWLITFILAYLIGIIFQYFTIVPMRHLSFGDGLIAALKADTLSLIAWQVGMYGWMAIVTFLIFGHELRQTNPVFWFMMQIAMLVGFLTAYPVNWWLVRKGLKEKM